MSYAPLSWFLLLFLIAGSAAIAADQPAGKSAYATVVKGNNEFALDLYAKLRSEPGNVIYSPYSISTALAMTYGGARGETAAEMARVLHFPAGPDALAPCYRELIQEVNGYGLPREYQLLTANALWGQRGRFRPDFLELTRANFGAGIRDVNFQFDPERARETINRWIESQTAGKIKDLLHKGDVDRLTELVLTNTIYFKAAWQTPFKPASTDANGVFRIAADQTVQIPLMQQIETLPYADAGTFQALALPYEGGDLQMLVLLPKTGDGLAELEKTLTADKLQECVSKLRSQRIHVTLPKFKITQRVDLADKLSSMGMSSAFTSAADFSGMNGKRDLFISKVIHHAFVAVDEEGTEAAAATAVIMARASAVRPALDFKADHPFLFLIRDAKTNSILFLGRLQNPKA